MEFQIFKKTTRSSKDVYYWRIVASHGKVIARSRKYDSFFDCLDSVNCVALGAFSAEVHDLTAPATPVPEKTFFSPDLSPLEV